MSTFNIPSKPKWYSLTSTHQYQDLSNVKIILNVNVILFIVTLYIYVSRCKIKLPP